MTEKLFWITATTEMKTTLLYNGKILTGQRYSPGAVLIEGDRIAGVYFTSAEENGCIRTDGAIREEGCIRDDTEESPGSEAGKTPDGTVTEEDRLRKDIEAVRMWLDRADVKTDVKGKTIMAGGIDAHVHFREPGMCSKADMESESKAALLGGITSFIDMPNTKPAAVTMELIEEKAALAAGRVYANYGFNIGASNDNLEELARATEQYADRFGGIKVFMGSSTGNMLVDSDKTLEGIFAIKGKPVLVHCEDESIIRENTVKAMEEYGDDIPFALHPEIRSRKACIKSSAKALELAIRYGTALHLLHVSTAEELAMATAAKLHNPHVTVETSANYLWFCDRDYSTLGSRIKCNPAIKSADDRDALRAGLKAGTVDTVGSDHAPHLATEKDRDYIHAPSGIPSIQHSLQVLLTVAAQEDIPLTRIAATFSEKTAEIFHIQDRGYLKEGNFADIVIVDTDAEITATGEGLLYRCGWSPYEGYRLKGPVDTVFVNGETVVSDGMITGNPAGQRLVFKRLNSKRTADNI